MTCLGYLLAESDENPLRLEDVDPKLNGNNIRSEYKFLENKVNYYFTLEVIHMVRMSSTNLWTYIVLLIVIHLNL